MADTFEGTRHQLQLTQDKFCQVLSLRNAEIEKLNNQLEQYKTLYTNAKLKYLLEMLEKYGKPDDITSEDWKFRTSQDKKWEIMFNSDEKHPWVDQFINCILSSCSSCHESEKFLQSKKLVKIMYEISDENIHNYYQDAPININFFQNSQVQCAISCLNTLESEMIPFNT